MSRLMLTVKDAKAIRKAYSQKEGAPSQSALAKEYRTSMETVAAICKGTHRLVADLNLPVLETRAHKGKCALTDKQVIQIRKLAAKKGFSMAETAKQFNVSRPTLSRVVKGTSYASVGAA